MSGRLSTRISIRWIPNPPSEPTDTLVMSVGGWYVDLRMTKSNGSIDWAMAGERRILSEEPMKCEFTHSIDSRGYTEPDIGIFEPIEPDIDLETGTMPNPDNNNIPTPYEEIWRSLPTSFEDKFPGGWILKSEDDKTFLGRIGGDFIALSDESNGFFARREYWDDDNGTWKLKYLVGSSTKPVTSMEGVKFESGAQWSDGQKLDIFGGKYVVCAVST